MLEHALGVLTRAEPSATTVAGRTDAGVHARGQVAHIDLLASVAEDPLLQRRLNGLLPDDVHVRAVGPAPPDFDARFSALSRTYCYRIADTPAAVDPLRRADTLAWPRPLADALLAAAGPSLIGEHDFAAYCRRREGATTIRQLTDLSWHRDPAGVITATVTADAFCHSMVRSLVGALIRVGQGQRPVDWPASLMARRIRANEVPVAPAHGLTLVEVRYPRDDQLAARAQTTRARRAPAPPLPPMT